MYIDHPWGKSQARPMNNAGTNLENQKWMFTMGTSAEGDIAR